MAAMTNFLENKLVDWLFRGQAIGIGGASAAAGTGPVTLYVGLFSITPSDGSNGTEISGGSYARATLTSSLATWSGTQAAATTAVSSGSSGTISNNNTITFAEPTANWGTVTGFGIFDAPSGGNLLFWGALSTSKTVNLGDAAPLFAAGALSIQIDD